MTAVKANAAVTNCIPDSNTLPLTQLQTSSSLDMVPSFYNEAFATGSNLDEDIITLDMATTSHMFGSEKYLSKITSIIPLPINVASKNGKVYANFKGTVHIGGLKLMGVLLSKELSVNLISAGLLYDEGFDIRCTASKNYSDKAVRGGLGQ
ncbi:hypothetical protein CROQUDRAFT_96372 [Cronartium quercuum f. sp. fusiforme G11]|uniref:Uncharacterized protein n=1 Tax=Cronartium quercuum f. sp. fusiforme G11 TaxID=708437 RepID=A0A9P6T8Q1_9BASI|nr:hypothetical protein CROQUDRAFT_96372 [Cronartium quercuum f. sp. fusiforme G11]